jgi:DNA-binding NarL/FixJ family response regulator
LIASATMATCLGSIEVDVSHKILIVDDSPVIRRSIRSVIERNTKWQVCGEAENGKVAVEKVKQLHPDVVILDWQMPVMNGVEAAKQIRQIAPSPTILMFTMHDCARLAKDAYAAGVKEIFSKSDHVAEHLVTALDAVGAAA